MAGHTSSSTCRQSRWQPLAHTWMGSCPPWRVVAAEGDSSSTRRAAAAWPAAADANSIRLAAASAVCTAVTGGMPAAEDGGGQGVGTGSANAAHHMASQAISPLRTHFQLPAPATDGRCSHSTQACSCLTRLLIGAAAAAAAAAALGCRLPLSERRVRSASESSGTCKSRACFTAGGEACFFDGCR